MIWRFTAESLTRNYLWDRHGKPADEIGDRDEIRVMLSYETVQQINLNSS
ncbi:hypothetical protein [Synechocystis sp. CACIAM 05]|nr:hypothetical protein [Synechocystis sp. CACIAM 05]